MQDGQVAGSYHPNRTEKDPVDLEYIGPLHSDTETETASADAGEIIQGGTCDSSFQCFLEEWSDDDDDSNPGDYGADSHPKPKKVSTKRARADGSSSSAAAGKAVPAAA